MVLVATTTQSIYLRFFSHVDKNGPVPRHCPELGKCWVWTGSRNKKGYGQFHTGGRGPEKKTWQAHRWIWVWMYGPFPEDKPHGLHHCDNTSCVRPTHIYPGTEQQNSDDKYARGRQIHLPGERNGRAKLTQAQVNEIRRLYKGPQNRGRPRTGPTQSELAKQFEVTQRVICLIVTNRGWK